MKRTGKKTLPAGKLPADILERLLKRYATPSPGSGVIVGPAIGIDAAVIDFHGRYLIAKTDPITFLAEDIGIYTIHVNANDIAVMGGTPRWFLATILLPEGISTARDAEAVFRQLNRACSSIGVTLCGGHTEITPGIDRTIVVGQMLGEVSKKGLITAAGAYPGDVLILTKGVAIEGTSIIARTHGAKLNERQGFSSRFISRCRNFVKNPGISVLAEARILIESTRVHAMHDPTEGGVATGVHELSVASGCGMTISSESIMIFPETARLCTHFGLDPLGLIASGSLLAAVPREDKEKAIKALKNHGIAASVIGEVTHKGNGVIIKERGRKRRLKKFTADEITKIL